MKIVVWDPQGDYWDGSLVDEKVASILESRDGVVLPILPELAKRIGVGGYMKRAWGSGWPLDFSAPRMCCPLTMFIDHEYRTLNWVARLLPDPRFLEDANAGKSFTEGQIRIIGDSGQTNAYRCTMTDDGKLTTVRDLGRLDRHGGWTAHGKATVHPSTDGYYGFSFYGAMPGIRVAWAAISLS